MSIARHRRGRSVDLLSPTWYLFCMVFHAALAIAGKRVGAIALLYPIATVLVAFFIAANSKRSDRIICAAAYVAGAEVVWRMTGGILFYELGKYIVLAMFLIALARLRQARPHVLALLFVVLLIPSSLISIRLLGLRDAREALSFNLAGPVMMGVAVWFLSHVSLTLEQWKRVLLTLVLPITGVAAVAVFGMASATVLHFGKGSNWATSGGFGPNQVSAVLGLGAFMSYFLLMSMELKALQRLTIAGMLVLCTAQSALTFSRGGLYCAGGAVVLASLYLIQNPRTRGKLLFAAPLIYLLLTFVVWPQLDNFTGGALAARFENTDTTGRDRLAHIDLDMFRNNPIYGVGPGIGWYYRGYAAHTELTRLLAEHGIFGLGAIVVLLIIALHRFTEAKGRVEKALVVSFIGWALLFMMTVAFRLVAPGLVFALASVKLLRDPVAPGAGDRKEMIPVQRRPSLEAAGARG
jgi:hypothetical protein